MAYTNFRFGPKSGGSPLYSDYKLEIITLSEYHEMKVGFDRKYTDMEVRITDIGKQIIKLYNEDLADDSFLNRFQPYIEGIDQLTRKMVIDFIEEITVDNDKNIKIKFKFEDELKKYNLFLNSKQN